MMDDDDFDDDFDPRGHNMQELGNDGPLDFDDSFDQAIEGQFDDSDIEDEELEDEAEDQFDEEDPDQEMHDRGTDSLTATIHCKLIFSRYRKITLPLTTQPT